MRDPSRLIIVSNRLPLVMYRQEGSWRVQPGSGGLVTALAPVLRDRGGLWIGWPGTTEPPTADLRRAIEDAVEDTGYELAPVFLDRREHHLYYQVFCNEVLWPLFHDMTSRCSFRPEAWEVYREVDARFAETVAAHLRSGDFVWIHDYHLMGVGTELRRTFPDTRLGFFLHIPFPPVDVFMKLPWRRQLLEDMLAFDLIGFQTQRDRRNFSRSVAALLPDRIRVRTIGRRTTVTIGGRKVMAGAFPIGIDAAGFARDAATEEVDREAWLLHENYPHRQILLGVDRLDYTKGIPEKLRAYRHLLHTHPERIGEVTLIQVVVPSRRRLPHYHRLKQEIERLVGTINGEFTRPGWVPVHYYFRSLSRTSLLAHYRAAEVLVVSPWKDGMNLVAKEYCASKVKEPGVLLLSEFAGAAAQIHRHSVMFNPHDIVGMAEAMERALSMPKNERWKRLDLLKRSVQRQDVFWWVDRFLHAAMQRRLADFPPVKEFYPSDPAQEQGLNM